MNNPCGDPDAEFLVLVNEKGRCSLWPVSMDVPAGWTVARPAGSRRDALEYAEATWSDMRPRGLVEPMADHRNSPRGRPFVLR
jgi:MbtH protein